MLLRSFLENKMDVKDDVMGNVSKITNALKVPSDTGKKFSMAMPW